MQARTTVEETMVVVMVVEETLMAAEAISRCQATHF
jgi:hypothetical protein